MRAIWPEPENYVRVDSSRSGDYFIQVFEKRTEAYFLPVGQKRRGIGRATGPGHKDIVLGLIQAHKDWHGEWA